MSGVGIRRATAVVLALALGLLAIAVLGRGDAPAASADCGLAANASATGQDGTFYYAVDALSPTDLWAVGTHFDGGKNRPYAAQGDGSAWTPVELPETEFTLGGVTLQDVAAAGGDDVWAVGTRKNDAPIAYRWDGSVWAAVATPRVASADESEFLGVDAQGPRDVWAVGMARLDGEYVPMAQRWDGERWLLVPTPPVAGSAVLQDVAIVASDDVWAVGWQVRGQRFRPLFLHWDGAAWRIVRSPDGPDQDAFLVGLAAASGDVWAVGWSGAGAGDERRALAMHLDAQGWSVIDLPVPSDRPTQLADVSEAPGGIAIAGQVETADGRFEPLTLRLDGDAWATLPITGVGAGDVFPAGIAAAQNGALTVVGTGVFDAGHGSFVAGGC